MAFLSMKKKSVESFPIGYIYMSTSNVNPSTYFGGTWESIGAGRCLMGVDPNDTDFNTVKKTGGEKTHTLTVAEMPSHRHALDHEALSGKSSGVWSPATAGTANVYYTRYEGGGQAHNNLPPYLTVYMWERTA